jgi:ABC-type lipoprotein export system ATPase subunit
VSLLELDRVSRVHRGDGGARAVLREASLAVAAGELAVVLGLRRSGRTTLLRVAAGIEPADGGGVCFDGRELAAHGERLLGDGIGFCRKSLPFADGQRALDHAMVGLLSRWVTPARARARAHAALERSGAGHCARLRRHELSAAEVVRVALARTLTLAPRLLVIDEPVKGVELIDRDGILALLRSLADDGIAVLASTGESTGLSRADRAYVIAGGEVRGAPGAGAPPAAGAEVIELRAARVVRG